MADIVRKILIIFVIGILYSIFVQSLIEAIYPSPDYDDYCMGIIEPRVLPEKVQRPENCSFLDTTDCIRSGGDPDYTYDTEGCAVSFDCNYCRQELDKDMEKYNLIVFIISSIFGLIAIAIGLYLPQSNSLNEWVATGFMLGGLLSLFIGTARYYSDMARMIRPVIIFIELVIVIYIAYKKIKK
ncbi:MAG: hypothetical protein V1740_06055 [Candidatus Woesearchaeota archaeon]